MKNSRKIPEEAKMGSGVTLVFEVEDSGIGIAPEAVARIFQPYQQADASITKTFGGTGLGLSICRRLVERMGGKIVVRSAPGAGAIFRFAIPVTGPLAQSSPLSGWSQALLLVKSGVRKRAVAESLAAWSVPVQLLTDAAKLDQAIKHPLQQGSPLLFITDSEELLAALSARHPGLLGPEKHVQGLLLCDSTSTTQDPAWIRRCTQPWKRSNLRAALAISPAPPAATESRALETGNEPLHLFVLVADDNDVCQHLVALVLQKLGCKVERACNGREVIDKVSQHFFDVIFMDCHMPEVDGCSAARAVRLWERDAGSGSMQIIALTAASAPTQRAQCLAAGMNDVLLKPLPPDAIRKYLAGIAAGPLLWEREVESMMRKYDELRRSLTEAMIPGLFRSFLNDSFSRLDLLATLVQSGDRQQLLFTAHALKGSASMFGAARLAALIRLLERDPSLQSGERAVALLASATSLLRLVAPRIQAFIDLPSEQDQSSLKPDQREGVHPFRGILPQVKNPLRLGPAASPGI